MQKDSHPWGYYGVNEATRIEEEWQIFGKALQNTITRGKFHSPCVYRLDPENPPEAKMFCYEPARDRANNGTEEGGEAKEARGEGALPTPGQLQYSMSIQDTQ